MMALVPPLPRSLSLDEETVCRGLDFADHGDRIASPTASTAASAACTPRRLAEEDLEISIEILPEKTDEDSAESSSAHRSKLVSAIVIFCAIHAAPSVPLLADVYKAWYGQPEAWPDAPQHPILPAPKPRVWITMQTMLIMQDIVQLAILYTVTWFMRGSIRECFNLRQIVFFAPAGALFALAALLALLAQTFMSADAYGLYTRCSLVVTALAWSISFKTPLSRKCWLGVILVVLGEIGFSVADTQATFVGLALVGGKIVLSVAGSLYAESCTKSDNNPLYVQFTWILPAALMMNTAMIFIVSMMGFTDEFYVNGEAVRLTARQAVYQLGFFHHWNWVVVCMVIGRMGDSFIGGAMAKRFDSVTKSVIEIATTIYPTQVVLHFVHPTPLLEEPKMMVMAALIMGGAFLFAYAKAEAGREARADEKERKPIFLELTPIRPVASRNRSRPLLPGGRADGLDFELEGAGLTRLERGESFSLARMERGDSFSLRLDRADSFGSL